MISHLVKQGVILPLKPREEGSISFEQMITDYKLSEACLAYKSSAETVSQSFPSL